MQRESLIKQCQMVGEEGKERICAECHQSDVG